MFEQSFLFIKERKPHIDTAVGAVIVVVVVVVVVLVVLNVVVVVVVVVVVTFFVDRKIRLQELLHALVDF